MLTTILAFYYNDNNKFFLIFFSILYPGEIKSLSMNVRVFYNKPFVKKNL